jgi:hypothetical protein
MSTKNAVVNGIEPQGIPHRVRLSANYGSFSVAEKAYIMWSTSKICSLDG